LLTPLRQLDNWRFSNLPVAFFSTHVFNE